MSDLNFFVENFNRQINYGVLLNREIQNFESEDYGSFNNKTVLVTGGCGSIGSALVKKLLQISNKVVIYDCGEFNYFRLKREIKDKKAVFILGNILDYEKLERTFKEYNFDYVFNAAAYKHLSVIQENPEEGIKTNVFGTLNLINLSIKYKVAKFLQVSTDKAINPSSYMGATKFLAEQLIISQNNEVTKFCAVRFVNVIGTSGSVVNIFLEQLLNNEPLTVTDKNMTRYFITEYEAVNLLLKSLLLSKGKEVFLLKTDEAIEIYQLALRLCAYFGKEEKILITQPFEGEKIKEEIIFEKEKIINSLDKNIFVYEIKKIIDGTDKLIENLKDAIKKGRTKDTLNEYLKLCKEV